MCFVCEINKPPNKPSKVSSRVGWGACDIFFLQYKAGMGACIRGGEQFIGFELSLNLPVGGALDIPSFFPNPRCFIWALFSKGIISWMRQMSSFCTLWLVDTEWKGECKSPTPITGLKTRKCFVVIKCSTNF